MGKPHVEIGAASPKCSTTVDRPGVELAIHTPIDMVARRDQRLSSDSLVEFKMLTYLTEIHDG